MNNIINPLSIYRAWINQPSTFDTLHRNHGTNVLAVDLGEGSSMIWYTSGDTHSSLVRTSWLSMGWNDRNRHQFNADDSNQPNDGPTEQFRS